MKHSGIWYEVVFEDGVRMNTPAESKEHAIKKAPKYHSAKVKSVRPIGGVTKKNVDNEY